MDGGQLEHDDQTGGPPPSPNPAPVGSAPAYTFDDAWFPHQQHHQSFAFPDGSEHVDRGPSYVPHLDQRFPSPGWPHATYEFPGGGPAGYDVSGGFSVGQAGEGDLAGDENDEDEGEDEEDEDEDEEETGDDTYEQNPTLAYLSTSTFSSIAPPSVANVAPALGSDASLRHASTIDAPRTSAPSEETPAPLAVPSKTAASKAAAAAKKVPGKSSLKLSRDDKVAIILEHDEKPSLTQQETATKWSVDRSTISKILHSRHRWLSPPSPPPPPAPRKVTVRPQGGRFKVVEERVNEWLDVRYRTGLNAEDGVIRRYAKEVWTTLQHERGGDEEEDGKGFKGSVKWLGSFKDRRRLSGRMMYPLPAPRLHPSSGQRSASYPHATNLIPGGSGQVRGAPNPTGPPYSQGPSTLSHRLSSLSIPSSSSQLGTAHPSPTASHSPQSATTTTSSGPATASGSDARSRRPSPRERAHSASALPHGAGPGTEALLSPFAASTPFTMTPAALPSPAAAGRPARRPSVLNRGATFHPLSEHEAYQLGAPGSQPPVRPQLGQRSHSTNSLYPHYQAPADAQPHSASRRRLGSGYENVSQRRDSCFGGGPPDAFSRTSRNSSRTESWTGSSPAISLFDHDEEERRRNSSATSYTSHFGRDNSIADDEHTRWYYGKCAPPQHPGQNHPAAQPQQPRSSSPAQIFSGHPPPGPPHGYRFSASSLSSTWSADARPEGASYSTTSSPVPPFRDEWHISAPSAGPEATGWNQPMSVDPHEFSRELEDLKIRTPTGEPGTGSNLLETTSGWGGDWDRKEVASPSVQRSPYEQPVYHKQQHEIYDQPQADRQAVHQHPPPTDQHAHHHHHHHHQVYPPLPPCSPVRHEDGQVDPYHLPYPHAVPQHPHQPSHDQYSGRPAFDPYYPPQPSREQAYEPAGLVGSAHHHHSQRSDERNTYGLYH